mmetsp:Transcript_77936/g.215437  ORF Transcript_77936/g.215437 Transcript_77936/m.215437 type:complete len:188 (+) Transcript_77936:549-1112(+)
MSAQASRRAPLQQEIRKRGARRCRNFHLLPTFCQTGCNLEAQLSGLLPGPCNHSNAASHFMPVAGPSSTGPRGHHRSAASALLAAAATSGAAGAREALAAAVASEKLKATPAPPAAVSARPAATDAAGGMAAVEAPPAGAAAARRCSADRRRVGLGAAPCRGAASRLRLTFLIFNTPVALRAVPPFK